MPKLEDLELKVKQTGSISTKGFKNLSEALERLSAAVKSFPSKADNVASINSAIKSIDVEKANALSKVATGLAKLANSASKVDVNSAGNIAAIGAAIEQMVDGINVSKLDSISEALLKFKTSVNALKNGGGINKAKKAVADATGGDGVVKATLQDADSSLVDASDKTAEVGEEAAEATEKVEKFRTSLRGVLQSSKSSAWDGLKKHFKQLQDHLKKMVGGALNLVNAFKRIAMYRMLRTAIKSITQGFATGIKHLYEWSDLVGNNFKQSMDSLSTSANYLRNSLGAMVSPIIDALAPAVEILVEKFVELLNVINQFLATITGADSWRKAVRQQKEYVDNTEAAAGAQKKLNHQLMAFDELNNLSPNNGGGRGSGAAASDVDDGSFVVEAVPEWAKDIRKAIEEGDWFGAGQALANKINGLLDEFDANAFGRKLADKIQNGIDAYNGFMGTLHWSTIGMDAAQIVNALFANVTPESVGQALVQHINAGIGFLKGLVIGEYKEYIDPTTGETFKVWKDGLDFSGIGEWIGDAIMTAITSIKWEDLGETIGSLASGLATLIVSAIHEIKVTDILEALRDFFGGLVNGLWGEDGEGMKNILELTGWVLGIKAVFGGLKAAFSSTFGDAMIGGAAEAFSATGTAATSVKGFMDTFAGKLGTIALVVGVTYYLATSGELNTPDVAAEKVKAENPFFNVFNDSDTDTFKQGFLDALKNDPVVRKAYEDNLYQWGKDSVHQDQNAALAAARAKYEELLSSGGVTSTAGRWDTDASMLNTALEKLTGKNWEIKVTDKDGGLQKATSRGQKLVGSGGLGGIKKEYKTKLTSPSLYEAEEASGKVYSDLTTMDKKKHYGLQLDAPTLKTGAANADKLKDGIGYVNGKTVKTSFKSDSLKSGADRATTIKDAIKSFGGKKSTFTLTAPTLKDGATNAASLKKNVNELDGTSATTTVDFTTSNYEDTWDKIETATKPHKGTVTIDFKATTSTSTTGTGKGAISINEVVLKANGGYVSSGDIFVANEAGPELVGTINGRTAVASNQEITGITEAVYDTGASEAALLREQNQLLRQLLAKKTDITLAPNVAAGRWVAQAQTAYARATGG